MLILKRKKDQVICIGDSIRIMVTDIGLGWVKFGIEAPKAVAVHRQEVYGTIQRKKCATNGDDVTE